MDGLPSPTSKSRPRNAAVSRSLTECIYPCPAFAQQSRYAGLTVPGQGLLFQGMAYSSWAGLTFLRRAYCSRARLTVPGQGLQFPGRAYGSWAGLTVSGHSDVPLSGLGRWMACPALLQKAVLGMPQYPVASQNAYTPAQLLHSNAAAQILSQCRCHGGLALNCCANFIAMQVQRRS